MGKIRRSWNRYMRGLKRGELWTLIVLALVVITIIGAWPEASARASRAALGAMGIASIIIMGIGLLFSIIMGIVTLSALKAAVWGLPVWAWILIGIVIIMLLGRKKQPIVVMPPGGM